MTGPDIVVVGSANVDLVVPVDRLPLPGETVLGGDHLRAPGGKGANQAVAAARLGRRVELVARVGDDDLAEDVRAALRAAGVGTGAVTTTPGRPTGLALITVDATGENTITVSSGANATLDPADVAAATSIGRAGVVLLQLEVPIPTVVAAGQAAAGDAVVVLNPAPAAAVPQALWDRVDVVVPNRTELAQLVGADVPNDLADVARLARRLPTRSVVVTLGADGALVADGDTTHHVPPVQVDVVDATGAGDAFCGGLADALARGLPVVDAASWAVRVAGLATTGHGAQSALPARAEVGAAPRGPAPTVLTSRHDPA